MILTPHVKRSLEEDNYQLTMVQLHSVAVNLENCTTELGPLPTQPLSPRKHQIL